MNEQTAIICTAHNREHRAVGPCQGLGGATLLRPGRRLSDQLQVTAVGPSRGSIVTLPVRPPPASLDAALAVRNARGISPYPSVLRERRRPRPSFARERYTCSKHRPMLSRGRVIDRAASCRCSMRRPRGRLYLIGRHSYATRDVHCRSVLAARGESMAAVDELTELVERAAAEKPALASKNGSGEPGRRFGPTDPTPRSAWQGWP